MEWLSSLIGVGTSVASGGLFGLIGSLAGVGMKMWQKKQDREWEKEKFAMDIEARKLNMDQTIQEIEGAVELAGTAGAWAGMTTSMQHDMALTSDGGFVNGVKSLFRPFLTTLLVCVSLTVFVLVWSAFTSKESGSIWLTLFSETELKDLLKYMVYSLYFASTTSIVWWFGERSFAPPGLKNR
tara:strand:+ start:633 stop:1181 length:549 start_codon:yes stop_codon:yes gene_type:complete